MKRKAVFTLLVVAILCMCVGCKKKGQAQQMETVKQEMTAETAQETETSKETEAQTAQQKTTETENTVQGNTEAGTDKQAAENSTVTSQENVETEELEIGGEDSWEDSADGWD